MHIPDKPIEPANWTEIILKTVFGIMAYRHLPKILIGYDEKERKAEKQKTLDQMSEQLQFKYPQKKIKALLNRYKALERQSKIDNPDLQDCLQKALLQKSKN